MPTSTANATWDGGLRDGKGSYQGQSGLSGTYSFATRFGGERGSTPEELLAAAEAACFSMALSKGLQDAGLSPQRVATNAQCTIEKVGEGFKITTMKLDVTVTAPGLDAAKLQEIAEATKKGCPVSVALAGIDNISVEAKLA